MDKFIELIIPRSTVESISHQEISNLMVGFGWRKNLWRQPQQLIQIGAIEIIGAALIFMVSMVPIDRLLNIYYSTTSPTDRTHQTILVSGIFTLVGSIGINAWIYDRGRRLQHLSTLVEKIEKYNQIVKSVETLTTVNNLTTNRIDAPEISIVWDVLAHTRHNLITALEIDRHLRHRSGSTTLQTAFLEPTLSTNQQPIDLQDLTQHPQLAAYFTLLDRAWAIGVSVDRSTDFHDI
jgi:hypothetical protein